ncbi:MAG TPA: alpha/beta hydrolase [Candidatus Dormibacteraeota bacterium]|nr:alpha/beta hydrolase [Candidatus Dormibacteraeota bacterium]
MKTEPIILVPGFWIGAWAWDEVAQILRDDGHDVTALTLPGLESRDVDRSNIRLSDHVDAIVAAVEAAGRPVVLAVHSGASVSGYAASDRIPDRIATMVYVDTAPGSGAVNPDLSGPEWPLPTAEQLAEGENLTGLSETQLATMRDRAVPEPAGAVRDAPDLTNDRRLDVPSVVICTGASSDDYKKYAGEGYAWMDGLTVLRNVRYIDLPTSHWPMWSRPKDLARILGEIASES